MTALSADYSTGIFRIEKSEVENSDDRSGYPHVLATTSPFSP
jgi:hypothetical protein